MKKLLLGLLAVAPAGLLGRSQSAIYELIELRERATDECDDWMAFHKMRAEKEIDQMRRVKKDWMKFGDNKLREIAEGKDQGNRAEAFWAEKLKQARALHHKHRDQWRKLDQILTNEKKRIIEKYDEKYAA